MEKILCFICLLFLSVHSRSENIIGVKKSSNGKVNLIYSKTGLKYIPRGYNYTHVRKHHSPCRALNATYHSTFNVGGFDTTEAAKMLKQLKELEYNVVRVFLNPGCMLNEKGAFLKEYIKNLASFVKLAKDYNQLVIITTDGIPGVRYNNSIKSEKDITWENTQYLLSKEIDEEIKFWKEFILALKNMSAPLDNIFSYELRNEMYYNKSDYPFNIFSGTFRAANGKEYDLSKYNEKLKLISESTAYWINNVRSAIKEVDSSALVSVGFFGPESAGRPALDAIRDSTADFIDLHIYPDSVSSVKKYGEYFNLGRQQIVHN